MDRAPGLSVRLKLTLSYTGFLMLAGALLLAAVWVFLLRGRPDNVFVPDPSDFLRALDRATSAHARSFQRPWRCWPSCWCSDCWVAGSSPVACSAP